MLTEQNPPCAAWFGVPNWLAHQPVRAWLWSRPVKNASLRGSRLANRAEPVHREPDRLLPRDLPELAASAFAGSKERAAEPRRRVVLHDAGGAFRAEHPAVHRMVRIALDVPDGAVLQVHPDPAPARAHVAGGGADLVADRGGEIDPAFHRGKYIPQRPSAIGPACFPDLGPSCRTQPSAQALRTNGSL